jgi:ABC-type lipoprotein release transport system permease subunit
LSATLGQTAITNLFPNNTNPLGQYLPARKAAQLDPIEALARD